MELDDKFTRQLDKWRKDLLTLDRRQRLLYFKHTKTASLELSAPSLKEMAELVAQRPTPVVAAEEAYGDRPELAVENKNSSELKAALRRLEQQSLAAFVDSGLWTLYLSIGMLRWIDPADDREVESPILLLPVRLQRDPSRSSYFLERTEDEVSVNPALRLKMELDLGVTLPDTDTFDIDVPKLLQVVREATAGRAGWQVQDRAVLTTFTFHKEAMYRDLLEHEALIAEHPMVQLVALGPDAPSAGDFGFDPVADDELDSAIPPEELNSILSADGSQRKCIIAARQGRSFVMDGPPGTGKSQTIANIIVELMSAGKSVLFVSEKAAALDVVRKRLTEAQLGMFLLELHSHAATRKQVAVELEKALTQTVKTSGGMSAAELQDVRRDRQSLSAYAAAMNEVRGLGSNVHDVLGRLAELHELSDVAGPSGSAWRDLTASRLSEILHEAKRLSLSWRPVLEGEDFLWRDLRADDAQGTTVAQLSRAASMAGRSVDNLLTVATSVDADLGFALPLTTEAVQRRVDLLELLHSPAGAPAAWLSLPELSSVAERRDYLRQQVTEYHRVDGWLSTRAGDRRSELDADMHAAVAGLTEQREAAWVPAKSMNVAHLRRVHDLLLEVPARLVGVERDSRLIRGLLGFRQERVSLRRAGELAQLAQLSGSSTPPERSWLRPGTIAALQESEAVLRQLVETVRARQESLRETFSAAALELDLHALHVRFRDTHKGFRKMSSAARADKRALKAVTVSGRVDANVLAKLEEAAAWQHAEKALAGQEQDHAPRLGSYYRRTETDFGRVARALANAQEAVRLAGADLDPEKLAGQIAVGGAPDPGLGIAGQRLQSDVIALSSDLEQALPEGHELLELTAIELGERAAAIAGALTTGLEAAEAVANLVGRDLTLGEVEELLCKAGEAAALAAGLFDAFPADQELLGPLYAGLETDWLSLDRAMAWTESVRVCVDGPIAPSVAEHMQTPTLTSEDVEQRLQDWRAARDGLVQAFQPRRSALLAAEFDAALVDAVELLSSMARTAAADIEEWFQHLDARRRLAELGLHDAYVSCLEERVEAGLVAAAFEYAALRAWTDATVQDDARLHPMRSADRDELAARFRQLDEKCVNEAHARAASSCVAYKPKSLASPGAALILREAQKKSRHLPIRELLQRSGGIAQRVKPCFMMSPLAVSRFLPADMVFDAVIFDEASQVLPSDAINCIYRGMQLIVAGDQKQLPPTNFFARAEDGDEEETDLDSFQSVLDLCKAAGALPSLPLTWHYRSQHESLITYSNYRFYDGRLHTFPGAIFEAPDLGVHSVHVDGTYRRGGARDNPLEAEAVVERVLHHRREHPELSIGVVAFSTAQEDAVTAALERRVDEEPWIGELLTDEDRLEGFFVKNLENVQGDERDIIVFSIGYGPDEHGKMMMNFGPLNREAGWRRLNVAITRARRRVEVVHSFQPGQIAESNNAGVRHLRGYLEFAQRGMSALAMDLEDSLGDAESPFEEDVLRVIAMLGYDGVPQVGAAGYRIDIGVKHPARPGEYALAVECDGAAYHSAKTARDRDRLREGVLRGLGWKVHRIWGISWVRNRDEQIARLRAAIEAAVRGEVEPESAHRPVRESVLDVEEFDFSAPPSWAVLYLQQQVRYQCPYEPHLPEARPYLRDYFERVLAMEAPVHEELLFSRFKADAGVGRIGSRIAPNLRKALSVATVDGARAFRDQTGFYRLSGRSLQAVRVPGEGGAVRSVAHTPVEEIDIAILRTVEDAGEVAADQITAVVARAFGWRRAGVDITSALRAGVSRLLAAGQLTRSDAGSYLRAP